MVHITPNQFLTITASLLALTLLAGCAQPGGPAPQVAQPAGAGRPATVCRVVGRLSSVNVPRTNPVMTVSSDGFCNVRFPVAGVLTTTLTVAIQPQHGQLEIGGSSTDPYARYSPTPGYEGMDGFTIKTATNGTMAEFAVTVVKP